MRRLAFVLFLLTAAAASAQQRVVLDLERTVKLAADSTLAAQRYRSNYDVSRYQYLAWQASRKPQFSLESTPLMFQRDMTQRYLSVEDVDVYRQQSLLYSQFGVAATQIFEPLGGQFYASSQLGILRTLGEYGQTQFMTIPISFGYKQDLLFFNPLKWAKQIEPMKMTLAEKKLAYSLESTSEEAVSRFFSLALAQEQLRMAEEYLASCDTIFSIAQRRFKIASISRAELSILELETTNARTTLANARIARGRAARELATYLGMESTTDIELVIPPAIGTLRVDLQEALAQARENNPQYLSSHLATEEARMEADRARVEKNLSVSLDASIGLNQVANRFADAYLHPLSQDLATITLSVPLQDWGRRRNTWLAAQSNVDVAEKSEQEVARDTELDIVLTVADFNERQAIVETAQEALAIAEDAYAQTRQQVIKGQADAYSLSVAQSHWQTARQNQIASLENYWLSYYHLRRLTLYDFQRRKPLHPAALLSR